MRLALGASRSRLIRQLLTESLLVALLSGGLGLAMAVGSMKALVSLLPADFPRVHEIHVSTPVFLFTFLISAITGILFGLVPAIQASRIDPKQGLHEGGRSATGSGRSSRLRNVLVASEVSLACVLLVGAGLMLRSLLNLLHLDPGFQHQQVLTANVSPLANYKKSADVARFFGRLDSDLRSLPGVQSAGVGGDFRGQATTKTRASISKASNPLHTKIPRALSCRDAGLLPCARHSVGARTLLHEQRRQ